MAEQLDLTTPIVKTTTNYKVQELRLVKDGTATVYVRLSGPNNEVLIYSYLGATATVLITALNKVDLSVKSLERRILERLVADGVIAGTISGSPD